MSITSYILKDKIALPCADVTKWAEFMATEDRRVARTQYDNIIISTVFLGIDHRMGKKGDPILFETMIFEDENYGSPVPFSLSNNEFSIIGDNRRYSFYAEAEEGHEKICGEVKSRLDKARAKASDMTYELVVKTDQDIDHRM